MNVIRERESDWLLPSLLAILPRKRASFGNLAFRPETRGRSTTGWAGLVIAHVSEREFW